MACAVDRRRPIIQYQRKRRRADIANPYKKPKDHVIVDIDKFDKNNELCQVEYVNDIYKFYRLRENEAGFRDYRNTQPYLNANERAGLIDWLIHIHNRMRLTPETLYLAINIVDRYLSLTTMITGSELRLVGMCALIISSKYEEDMPLRVDPMEYSREIVLSEEKAILSRLGWYLSVPTYYVFAVRYAKASLPSDKRMEDMVFFFIDLGLMDYPVTITYSPSKLAASAVYAARCTLNKTPAWTETLKHYTGYCEDQLMDCAKILVSLHCCASKYKSIAAYEKYVNPDRSAVSLYPPATRLLVANRNKVM